MKARFKNRHARVGRKTVGFSIIVLAAIFFSLASAGTAQAATYSIRDDATGGDCASMGTWNAAAKTCTLTANLSADYGIGIESEGITLDGSGYILSGSSSGTGILIDAGGTSVTNLNIRQFVNGIEVYSDYNSISGINVSNCQRGIVLIASSYNVLKTDNISSNAGIGILADTSWTLEFGDWCPPEDPMSYYNWQCFWPAPHSSGGNAILNNAISSNGIGISLQGAQENVIAGNLISLNSTMGVDVSDSWSSSPYDIPWPSDKNKIYNNRLMNNAVQVNEDCMWCLWNSNSFNMPAPTGGNYWSDYNTPAQGCNDTSPADGFCDEPYAFSSMFGGDDLPWTAQDAWPSGKPSLSLSHLSPEWSSYADYVARELSVTWTVTDTGDIAANGVRITGSVDSNGVVLSTALPAGVISAAIPNSGSSSPVTLKYNIPEEVGSWHASLTASAMDSAGTAYTYP